MKRRFTEAQPDATLSKAFGSVASSLSDRGKALFQWLTALDTPQALEALSYTNLPQAAEVLANRYFSTFTVRPFLCRLGEIAVPWLTVLADTGVEDA